MLPKRAIITNGDRDGTLTSTLASNEVNAAASAAVRAVSFQNRVNYILSSYASITLSFTRNGKKRVLVASAKNVTNPTAIEKRSSVPRA